MPEEPGKYQTGFLLLSHAWDWKVKSQRFKFHMLPVSDQLRHFLQFLYCFLVGGFQIICHHTCDQKYFLSEMVKYDHLIKKH